MKKTTSKARVLKEEDMRPEYDFAGAVREYFPDSEFVNAALRSLIALMAELPAKRKPAAKKRSG